MRTNCWRRAALWAAAMLGAFVLAACGGGDTSVTTVSGPGLSALGASPPVSLFTATSPFVQKSNNLKVVVDGGPTRSFAAPSANIMYADVKVCSPGNAAQCVTIPHVQVDTGSVGLRVLASKVTSLNLPVVALPGGQEAWECYPFVIGGLWGRNAVADVTLGNQEAASVPIQLIQDGSGPQATNDCAHAAGGTLQADGTTYSREGILDSVDRLGSNGILGIGNTELDCAQMCVAGVYPSFVMYYGCLAGAASSSGCAATGIQANQQVYNPVAAFAQHNNGVVLALPGVPFPGASTVTGELIFGIDTSAGDPGAANNTRPGTATPVLLGTNPATHSYLNITTTYNSLSVTNSYLDTGTNGLFFSDNSSPLIALCAGSTWYCPFNSLVKPAILSDGDSPSQNPTPVSFTVDNAEAIFSTANTAFAGLAGAPSGAGSTFAWGLPFFYGRRVFLSIWRPSVSLPWYAWETIH
ncbi:MAG: hypothetical protein RL302_1306 [Pseudomonadota bacterium]|jgi:Protein of unknown function (DUF3443)